MDVAIRPVAAEEWVDYLRAEHIPFGVRIGDEEMKVQAQRFGAWNTLAAFQDGRIVATAGDWDMHLTLPGLTQVHAPGVTAVGVLPTHRRRGLLTALMRRQLDDFSGRGEPVATLLAAESVIYGRFGYGWATTSMA
ncbi:MAG: GNAT family N-acetyltransferase, partial [Acidimicrobiia bacterium]|nr:GNAT family N-acetyltransferase [Acidimicrobiia bacterium]